MSSNQKRGFRLPWGSEQRDPDEAATAAAMQALAATNQVTGAVRDDLGEGPFRLSGAAQPMTTDAAPAAADVPDDSPEAAMNDAEAPTTELSAAAPPEAEAPGAWPATDRRGPDRPFTTDWSTPRAESEPRLPRRDNPLVAGLVKAMREAAVASRAETTARLEAEATARVESIRARATTETANLRKRADEDVNGIREWSKAEIARLRQETEERIETRRAALAAETERHHAGVDRLVEQVKTTVAAFEADMDSFFERLLAESDPARLATLAEQAPDPPDLRGDGPEAIYDDELADHAHAQAEVESEAETAAVAEVETEAVAEVETEAVAEVETEAVAEADAPAETGLHADQAAEAEAAATEGLDPGAADAWPTAVVTAHRGDPVPSSTDANGPDSTRLLVSGLTSVAGISAFKGALGQLAGVRGVSVSSGAPGVFVFAVSHDPGVDLDSGLAGLSGFSAHVTDATDDGFTVAAQEIAA
jgi:hypothetical protein